MTRARLTIVILVALLLPLALPAAAQEATPEPAPALDLPEIYVNDEFDLSFHYPEGWFVDENDGGDTLNVIMASDEDIIDGMDARDEDEPLESGQIILWMAFTDAETLAEDLLDEPTGDVVELLIALAETSREQENPYLIGDVEETLVNDRRAARAPLITTGWGDGFIMLMELGEDRIVGLILITAPDELAEREATALAVVESMRTPAEQPPEPAATPEVTPEAALALTGVSSTPNNLLLIAYPDDWATGTLGSFGRYLANSRAALNHSTGGTFAPGEIQILVAVDTIANLTPTLNLGVRADATPLEFLEAAMETLAVGFDIGEYEELEINDWDAARVTFSTGRAEGVTYTIALDERVIAIFQVLTAPDELESWMPTIEAMLAALSYNE